MAREEQQDAGSDQLVFGEPVVAVAQVDEFGQEVLARLGARSSINSGKRRPFPWSPSRDVVFLGDMRELPMNRAMSSDMRFTFASSSSARPASPMITSAAAPGEIGDKVTSRGCRSARTATR